MSEEKHFLLLDIDGVLLESNGYRLACIDTVNYFLYQFGQPHLSIDRTITDAFETAGITAEWDMVPLTLAAFINWYLQINEKENVIVKYPILLEQCDSDSQTFRQYLLETISVMSKMLDSDKTPINAVYQYLSENNGKGLRLLWDQPIRDLFFLDTLNPWQSPFFANLMNRILGSDAFERFYNIPACINCRSYLETKDELLISEYYRNLLPEMAGKTVFPVIMTYRPTKLPDDIGNNCTLYYVNTPEGECALRLLGWDDGRIPMIGAGSLCYIEDKYHLRREYYVKPHPFHALASLIMGISRDEIISLETARELCEISGRSDKAPLDPWISMGEEIRISVFEDSVSGINSVKNAVSILNQWGFNTKADLYGIHTTRSKDERLSDVGAKLFQNINEALHDALSIQ